MAISFYSKTNKQLKFKEFIDIISKIIVFGDEESLLDCVKPLFELSNNKFFFRDFLNDQLSIIDKGMQSNNPYSEQSYMLYSCDSFYVRMTYWPILSNNTKVRESQSSLFSYGMVHDHNFSLLTTGYLGDGYKTKLWEYDYNKVIGYPNEVVDLKFLEETRLTPDKALFYRPSKDIHCQYAPENEDSLALNIILKSHKQFDNRQYEFDIENKKIKKILYGSGSSKFSIIKLASLTNNSKTIDLLKQLVINNEIPLVRKECLDSLYKIEKTKDIWELGVRDKDKSISEYSKLKLEGKL